MNPEGGSRNVSYKVETLYSFLVQLMLSLILKKLCILSLSKLVIGNKVVFVRKFYV